MTQRLILFPILLLTVAVLATAGDANRYNIPLIGNTYFNRVDKENIRFAWGRTKDKALVLTKDTSLTATTYVYFACGQKPSLSLSAKGKGKIAVTIDDCKPVTINIASKEWKAYKLGRFKSNKDGYMRVHYRLLQSPAAVSMQSLVVDNVDASPIFLKEGTNTYFGLRGPSCHLNYLLPRRGAEVDWATISVTVPEEFDPHGSYYMALGFSGGYFGFQNNSQDRRNVLFSVWNTQDSDDPKAVDDEHKVQVISHGEGVTAKDFGHEGSGKQSFINIGWLPGHTYQFLLHASRVDSSTVDYSAWMYDSVKDVWVYLSTLRRPNTKVLLTGLHSFLENFDPLQGNKTRKAYYHDGWAHRTNGEWVPLRRVFLTCDGTGNSGRRLDFNGGVEDGRFFLTNGGYFDRSLEIERAFSIDEETVGDPPAIDFSQFNH